MAANETRLDLQARFSSPKDVWCLWSCSVGQKSLTSVSTEATDPPTY